MQFDTKIAIVLDEQLAGWQKANVTAFLISGIAATDPALVGESYIDGSGNRYLPMCRQPIMVYAADRAGLPAAPTNERWRAGSNGSPSSRTTCSPHTPRRGQPCRRRVGSRNGARLR